MLPILYFFATFSIVGVWNIPLPKFLVGDFGLEVAQMNWDMLRACFTLIVMVGCLRVTTRAVKWIDSR